MKNETAEAKLRALLAKHNPEAAQQLEEIVKKSEHRQGILRGVSEDEIQEFREVQGLMYFLQAPELFSERTCKWCHRFFLVSRMYVAYCSYECIERSIKHHYGFEWTYHDSYEKAALKVFEGNEPIWIRNLDNLKKCLTMILRLTEGESQNSPDSTSAPVPTSNQENTSSTQDQKVPPTSSTPTTTSRIPIPIPKT